MPREQWEHVLAVNLHAPFHFNHRLAPVLMQRPESHILHVASMLGFCTFYKCCAYSVSKHGLVAMSESLRAEYAAFGLGVSVICPGFVRTAMLEDAFTQKASKGNTARQWLSSTPDRVARLALKSIRRNRAMTVVTPLAHVAWRLKRFVPWLYEWTIRRRTRRIPNPRVAQRSDQTIDHRDAA